MEASRAMRKVDTSVYGGDVGRQSATTSLHDEVRRLARNWSLELTPGETQKLGTTVREHVPAGTRVYITWLAGSEFAPSVAAAAKLRGAGLEPVPHLAARAIRDRSALVDMLVRLRAEADVKQVLVIGGAVREPKGSFDASIQVLNSGLFERHGIRRLGVAAHPEGSPDIAPAALDEALVQKNEYAARSGSELELTTQFCFDPTPITQWESRTRAAGNRLPVAVGLAGLAGVTTLIKHARNCGVGNSIGVLLKQTSKVLRLATAVDPSNLVLGLARARQADAASAIRRLHFFPFGAFEATAQYARALDQGRFEIVDAEHRIVVSR
jgi:methylenetetrahydrofolate reductase (NADPH)